MRILITRHGKTHHNINGIVQGWNEGEVSELGFKQIEKLIKRLKKEKINRIISSDIPRCVTTTSKITEQIDLPIEYSKLIREKNSGDFAGRDAKEVDWDSLGDDFENRKPPNGESLAMVRDRSGKFFEELVTKGKEDETILIVSHGGFLKAFLGDMLGMSIYDSIFNLFIEHCSLSELIIDDRYKNGCLVKTLNEQSFLGKLGK